MTNNTGTAPQKSQQTSGQKNAHVANGTAFTQKGVMPPDKVARWKLLPDQRHEYRIDQRDKNSPSYRRLVKRSVELVKTAHYFSKGVVYGKLPSQVLSAVHYFAHPFPLSGNTDAR